MSKQVNKEQTKAATQEENTELTDEQLVVAAGGSARELNLNYAQIHFASVAAFVARWRSS